MIYELEYLKLILREISLQTRKSLGEGVSAFGRSPMQGGGDPKIPLFAGRPLWTAPTIFHDSLWINTSFPTMIYSSWFGMVNENSANLFSLFSLYFCENACFYPMKMYEI